MLFSVLLNESVDSFFNKELGRNRQRNPNNMTRFLFEAFKLNLFEEIQITNNYFSLIISIINKYNLQINVTLL